MSSLLDRLDAYPALSPDERAEVVRAVGDAGDPDLAQRLAEAQSFAALLDLAGPPDPSAPLDVAQHVTDQRLGHATEPRNVARILLDPELGAEAERVSARLDAVAAEAEDPVAQFERLSGHSLSPTKATDRPRAADRASAPAPRAARISRMRLVRGLAVAAAVCVAAYGGLALISGSSVSERARVADLDGALGYRTSTLRSDARTDDPAAPLVAALDRLNDARSSTLGLFPSYDEQALDGVAEELETIADGAARAGQSAVQQEALLTLGRVRLYQGDADGAAAALEPVVAMGNYAAPEARRLLDYAVTLPTE